MAVGALRVRAEETSHRFRRRALCSLVLVLGFSLTACGVGANKSLPQPNPRRTLPTQVTIPASIPGVWAGAWRDTAGGSGQGDLHLDWQRVARVLRGRLSITGFPCVTDGDVEGAVSGASTEINVVQDGHLLTLNGTIVGTGMSGTYLSNCTGGTGTWEMTKS